MKSITLTQGKVALVDDKDYEGLVSIKWFAKKDRKGNWYAGFVMRGRFFQMHRLITMAPANMKVDHRDGNGLNNQRSNLRVCTNAENSRNRKTNRNNTTGYKGVTPEKGRYRARIKVNYRLINLGSFDSAMEAGSAYDEAAKKYHGEFAKLNFPD